MANFNVDYTEPQGAGANARSPVPGVVGRDTENWPGAVADIAKAFFDYKRASKEKEIDLAKQAAIQDFSERQAAIVDAVNTGQMTRSQAAVKQRTLATQFYTQYPAYQKELGETNKLYMTGTELGEFSEEEQAAQQAQREFEKNAINAGFPITPTTSPKTREALLASYSVELRNEKEFKKYADRVRLDNDISDEQRKAYQFDNKQRAASGLNEIGESYVTSTVAFVNDLANEPDKELAAQKMTAYFSQIKHKIASVSREFPDLASNWNKIFDDMQKVAQEITKPDANLDKLKRQWEEMSMKARIMYFESDPKIQGLHAANMVTPLAFGAMQKVNLLDSLPAVERGLAAFTTEDNSDHPVIGKGEVEKGVYDTLISALNKLEKGDSINPEVQKEQIGKAVNNILNQAGDKNDPKALNQVSSFIASSDYHRMNKLGLIKPEQAAKFQEKFETVYQKEVATKISEQFDEMLFVDNIPAGNLVEIKERGGVIMLVPRSDLRNRSQELEAKRIIEKLKNVPNKLNELVKAGAHLEGHQNYSQYWETAKPLMFPQMFNPDGTPVNRPLSGKKKESTDWWSKD